MSLTRASLFAVLKEKVNKQLIRLDEAKEKFYLSSPLAKANKIRDALSKLEFALQLKAKLETGTLKTYQVMDEWDLEREVEVISVNLSASRIIQRDSSETPNTLDILIDTIRECDFATEEAMLNFSFLAWTDGMPANYAGHDDDGIRPGFYPEGSLKAAIDAPRFMGSFYSLFFDTNTWDAFKKSDALNEKVAVPDHTRKYNYS